ncbi:MAG: hypothetical protein ACM3MI_09090 [Clostridiales bacterium]
MFDNWFEKVSFETIYGKLKGETDIMEITAIGCGYRDVGGN